MPSFTVNGQPQRVDVESDTPLLWVVRDELKLKGTKFGCGLAQCGACTVHMDGQPIRSCVTPVAAVEGREITTIEGIKPQNGEYHVLQQAWIDEQVPQCGYCQSGQIMSAAALLSNNTNPNDADIDAAMSGNVCRCGMYDRIKKAIKLAASRLGSDPAPLGDSSEQELQNG